MNELPVFARRLKQARTAAGISQKNLGIAAGIDEFSASPRINQYERGRHVPDLATAERLAEALGIPTPFLFARDDALAEVILLYGRLRADRRRTAMQRLRALAQENTGLPERGTC